MREQFFQLGQECSSVGMCILKYLITVTNIGCGVVFQVKQWRSGRCELFFSSYALIQMLKYCVKSQPQLLVGFKQKKALSRARLLFSPPCAVFLTVGYSFFSRQSLVSSLYVNISNEAGGFYTSVSLSLCSWLSAK